MTFADLFSLGYDFWNAIYDPFGMSLGLTHVFLFAWGMIWFCLNIRLQNIQVYMNKQIVYCDRKLAERSTWTFPKTIKVWKKINAKNPENDDSGDSDVGGAFQKGAMVVEQEIHNEKDYEAFLMQKKRIQANGKTKLDPWVKFSTAQYHLIILLAIIFVCNVWPGSYPRNMNANASLFWSVLLSFFIVFCSPIAVWIYGKQSSALVPVKPGESPEDTAVNLLVNRHQTDEWKGWMQVFFLLYHYYRAHFVYNEIRICVSAYVWLTGFGNWSYFMIKRDFSYRRLVMSIFRINFFPVVCSLDCGVPFALYYVVPLHTFWFGVSYATAKVADTLKQRFPGQKNLVVFAVILTSFGAMALLFEYLVPNFFFPASSAILKSVERRYNDLARLQEGQQAMDNDNGHEFQILARYFQLQFMGGVKDFVFTIKECCFRFQLERYSGLWGIVAAEYFTPILRIFVRWSHKFAHDTNSMTEKKTEKTSQETTFEGSSVMRHQMPHLKIFACDIMQFLTGFGLLWVWWNCFGSNRDKFTYNEYHSLHLFLPITGYLLIRNTSTLKKYFSRGFAFVGGMTLETYILQFHTLMCRNVSHILVIFPSAEVMGSMMYYVNTFVVTFVLFLGTSWYARKVTNDTQEFVDWYFFKRSTVVDNIKKTK